MPKAASVEDNQRGKSRVRKRGRRAALVRHRSHAGRQPEVCIRVDLHNFNFIFKFKFEFRVWPAVFWALVVFF